MTSPQSFASLGLPAPLVDALAARGITEPTPIQAASIGELLDGHDLVAGAPTGSGKTLAFGLPVLAAARRGRPYKPATVVLTPTRELAGQIHAALDPLAEVAGLTVFAVYGGVSMFPQRSAMKRGVDILVATPGRLEDLIEQRYVDLDGVQILVIDEADRMADAGFLPSVRRVLDATPQRDQTVLFSATTDDAVGLLVAEHLPAAKRVDVQASPVDLSRTTFFFWTSPSANRAELTAEIARRSGRTIVFTRTKHGADRVAEQLTRLGVDATAIHGGRSQAQREKALAGFQAGRTAVLVATDVAARGIHVDDVGCVVHHDLPELASDFTHRSGRTARAGASGVVVALVVGDKVRHAKRLARELGRDEALTAADVSLLPERGAIEPVRAAAPTTRLRQEHYEDAGRAPKPFERGGDRSRGARPAPGDWSPDRASGPRRFDRDARPARSFDRDARPARSFDADRRPERSFDRDARPAARFDRDARPARSFDRDARPARSFDGDRPARSFDADRRPERSFDRDARPARSFDRDARPARSFDGDRPARSFDADRRPERSFDRDARPARSFDRDARPARSFDRDARPAARFDRDARPARSFDRDARPAARFGDDRPAARWDRAPRGEGAARGERTFGARPYDRAGGPRGTGDRSASARPGNRGPARAGDARPGFRGRNERPVSASKAAPNRTRTVARYDEQGQPANRRARRAAQFGTVASPNDAAW